MLNQLKALLNDKQLQQQIKASNSLADAIALLTTTGVQKGCQFSRESIYQLIQEQSKPIEHLDENTLSIVAGGLVTEPAWTNKPPPQIC
ncbi:MAG: Nif11-like leader peptide family natural product precursor [Cyanobacteria bacterium P01_B01_bin.77]